MDPLAANVSIREAKSSELPALRELLIGALAADPTDPHLQSFRHELAAGPDPGERFVEYAVLVNGELGARCKINFQPQGPDIDAYGPRAAGLLASERVGTLTGDLVAPAFRGRGLHAAMIRWRLNLLASEGFTYAMCGILVGNAASEANYLRLGFEPIGEKDIDWGAGAVGGRISRVVLYGRWLGS